MYKKTFGILLLVLCLPVLVFAQQAQLPPKVPFSASVWQNYIHSLLKKISQNTQYAQLAVEVTIKVEDDNTVDASSFVDKKEIWMTRGRIELINDKADLIGVIGHEFGHIALGHTSTQTLRFVGGDDGGVITDTDFALFEKQEVEADQFAVDLLKLNLYDPCARYRGFLKLLDIMEVTTEEEPGPFNIILLRRLDILRKPCEQPSN